MEMLKEANKIAQKILQNDSIVSDVRKQIKQGKSLLEIKNWTEGCKSELENSVLFPLWMDCWQKIFDSELSKFSDEEKKRIYMTYYENYHYFSL